jgi:hypothetical protein
MFKQLLGFLFLGMLSISCTEIETEINKQIEMTVSAVAPQLILKEVNHIFIIPIRGCSGCVEKVINFMKENLDHANTLYIIVAKNKSEYASYFDDGIFKSDHIIFDSKLISISNKLANNYPVYYGKSDHYFNQSVAINASNIEEELSIISRTINSE